jgi:hypothetical protein
VLRHQKQKINTNLKGANDAYGPCQPCPGGFACTSAGLTEPVECTPSKWCPPPGYCDDIANTFVTTHCTGYTVEVYYFSPNFQLFTYYSP